MLHRIALLYQERGLSGTIRFAFSRLFVGQFRRVLYDYDAQQHTAGAAGQTNTVLYDATTSIPPDVLAFVGPRNEAYLEGIPQGDLLYVTKLDGTLVHYGFVLCRTRETAVLREATGTPLIGNCWTDPRVRGRGIYPEALRAVLVALAARGVGQVLIETDISNNASRRGIEKAGFRLRRVYRAVILFNAVVAGVIEDDYGHRLTAWRICPRSLS